MKGVCVVHSDVKRICALEYLKYVRALAHKVSFLQQEISYQRERLDVQGVSYDIGSAHAVDSDVLPAGVIKLIELIDELNTDLVEYVEQQQIAMSVFDQLSNPLAAQAMRLYYLHEETWEEIAVELKYSYRQIIRIIKLATCEIYELMPEQWRRDPIPNSI